MSLKSQITLAVNTRNAKLAGNIADTLRFRLGMSYNAIHEYVNSVEPVEIEDWEDLMYEADSLESVI